MVQFECPKHLNPPVSFTFEVGRIPLSHYWPSGVIRLGSLYESEKDGKFPEQKWFKGMQMVQFDGTRHQNPSVLSNFGVGRIPLSHYWLSGVIEIGLPVKR